MCGGGLFLPKNLFFGILVTILGGAFTYPIFAKERYRNGEALKMLFLKCFLGQKRFGDAPHLGTGDVTKTDDFSEKFQRGGGHFQSKNYFADF